MPEVSVIIPTYNSEKFIEHTLKSVLNQTFQDFEIIVVDDASIDKTKEIIKKIQLKEKRIRLIELEENSGGPAIPTNVGIKEAKSPFISILEADDFYLPDFLRSRLDDIKKNNLDWNIGSSFYVFLKNSRFIKYARGSPVSTWVVRKDLFEKAGYFKKTQDGFQDAGFSIRVVKSKNIKIGLFPTPLTVCFVHSQSNTYFFDNIKKKSRIFIERLKSLLDDASGLKDWEAVIYWKLGNYYCLLGEMREGRKHFEASLKLKPNINSPLFYLLSFLGKTFYFRIWRMLWFAKNILFEKLKLLFYIGFKYRNEYFTARGVLNSFKSYF